MSEGRVLALLKDDPTWHTLGGIAWALDMPRRAVEEAVELLRIGGQPILGGSEGIKFTTNPAELRAYLEQRRNRAAAIHRGTMAMRTTLRRMEAVAAGYDPDRPTLWRAA